MWRFRKKIRHYCLLPIYLSPWLIWELCWILVGRNWHFDNGACFWSSIVSLCLEKGKGYNSRWRWVTYICKDGPSKKSGSQWNTYKPKSKMKRNKRKGSTGLFLCIKMGLGVGSIMNEQGKKDQRRLLKEK